MIDTGRECLQCIALYAISFPHDNPYYSSKFTFVFMDVESSLSSNAGIE